MRFLTCILVAVSLLLASAPSLLAGVLVDACPGSITQADVCHDPYPPRAHAANAGESGSNCLGMFMPQAEYSLAPVSAHDEEAIELSPFGGTEPTILLRPPRA